MPSTLALRWLSLGLLWAWAGCTRYQSCQAPPDCGEGHECLAFRCVPEGGEVVPEKSTRLLLLPDRLSSDVAPALGGTYELGPPHHAALYAAFALPRVRCAELASAFLLLDAAEPAQSPPRPLPLSVRRVRQAWSEREVASGQVPEEGLPEVRGSWLPPLTARVDVTDIVCSQLATDSAAAHGMVVRGLDGELALRVATGVDQKSPPRLELYLKPANPSATTAPSASGAHAARSP